MKKKRDKNFLSEAKKKFLTRTSQDQKQNKSEKREKILLAN
jgi:hypothetical protein